MKSVADRQPHNTTNALKWLPDVSDSWSRGGRVGGKPEEYRKPKQNKWFANVAWGGGDWWTARAGGLVLVRCVTGSGWAAVGDSDGGGERERPVWSVRHLCQCSYRLSEPTHRSDIPWGLQTTRIDWGTHDEPLFQLALLKIQVLKQGVHGSDRRTIWVSQKTFFLHFLK